MTDKVLKGCKKYVIKRVVNPSLYWMIECENQTCSKNGGKNITYLTARDVEKCTVTGKIPVGELIVIKNERLFLRGLVADCYKRNSEIEYRVLLLNCGNIIDIKQENIYLIKNEELRKKNLRIVKVLVHGIQPALMEIQSENNFLGRIFQKRVCNNWSTSAFEFVRGLILKNPCVFVKTVYNDKSFISGKIYFIQDGVPVDLGQILCDKGFALVCDTRPKLMIQGFIKGDSDSDIEEKIPDAALFGEKEKVKKKLILKIVMNNENIASDLIYNTVPYKQSSRVCEKQSASSTCSSSTISGNENSKSLQQMLFNSNSESYSSSWILKKCLRNTLNASSCESVKGENSSEFETRCSSPENPKVNIFRVIQRSLELLDKEKQHEK